MADPKWKHFDYDMKEAIDLRDDGGRDPAFYAAKALESYQISKNEYLTTGREMGAFNFMNLSRIPAGDHSSLAQADALQTRR